jgi:hypothetical protein
MAVTPFNIIQGPGQLFVASYPQTLTAYYPAVNPNTVAVTSPFIDAGGTTGGVTVEVDETMSDIKVDQLLDPVGARATARTIQVTTTLMETSLPQLQVALNGTTGATYTSTAAYGQLDLTTTTSATQPSYSVIIVDGWAPTLSTGVASKRRFIIQKALSQPKISQKFDMTSQATVSVTFTAYYVSNSVAPFSIIDGLQ